MKYLPGNRYKSLKSSKCQLGIINCNSISSAGSCCCHKKQGRQRGERERPCRCHTKVNASMQLEPVGPVLVLPHYVPKKKMKEGICEVECLAGTSGRQDTSSTVLIAANASSMQRPSVSPHRAKALTCYNAPLCGSNCCRCCEIYVHLWPPNHASTVAMHIALQVPVYVCVCVCVRVCLHATDSPLDTRVCKCSNIIVTAIRKSSLIWLISLICCISAKFEIKCLLCCQRSSLPLSAPRWGT